MRKEVSLQKKYPLTGGILLFRVKASQGILLFRVGIVEGKRVSIPLFGTRIEEQLLRETRPQ